MHQQLHHAERILTEEVTLSASHINDIEWSGNEKNETLQVGILARTYRDRNCVGTGHTRWYKWHRHCRTLACFLWGRSAGTNCPPRPQEHLLCVNRYKRKEIKRITSNTLLSLFKSFSMALHTHCINNNDMWSLFYIYTIFNEIRDDKITERYRSWSAGKNNPNETFNTSLLRVEEKKKKSWQ